MVPTSQSPVVSKDGRDGKYRFGKFRRSCESIVHLANKARKFLRGLLQAYGNEWIKKSLWNLEFSRGRWTCLEASPGDVVYKYIEKYVDGGSILDLGCGSGNT